MSPGAWFVVVFGCFLVAAVWCAWEEWRDNGCAWCAAERRYDEKGGDA